jgi:hypothetical protein
MRTERCAAAEIVPTQPASLPQLGWSEVTRINPGVGPEAQSVRCSVDAMTPTVVTKGESAEMFTKIVSLSPTNVVGAGDIPER